MRLTKSNQLLSNFNSLNRLEICYSEIQAKKLENFIRYSAEQKAKICRRKTFCMLKMAIFNLYNQLNNQSRKISVTSTGNVLTFIKNYIIDMEKVEALLAQDHQHSSTTPK
uniref:CCDC92 domain-containing protein n=1 Tax=Mesocestoides corti TaxID=53468 RepID=A0A5K3F1I9_MESCO